MTRFLFINVDGNGGQSRLHLPSRRLVSIIPFRMETHISLHKAWKIQDNCDASALFRVLGRFVVYLRRPLVLAQDLSQIASFPFRA